MELQLVVGWRTEDRLMQDGGDGIRNGEGEQNWMGGGLVTLRHLGTKTEQNPSKFPLLTLLSHLPSCLL